MSKKDRRNQEVIETTAVDETEKVDTTTDATTDDTSGEPKVTGAPVKVEKTEGFIKKVGRGIATGAKKVWNHKFSIGELVLAVGGTIAVVAGVKAVYNKGRKDAGDDMEEFDFNDIPEEEYEALTGEETEKDEPEETVETEVVDDSEETEEYDDDISEEYDDDISEEETEYEDEDVIEEEDE